MSYPYLAPIQPYNPYGAAAANPYDGYASYNPYVQQAPNPYAQQAPNPYAQQAPNPYAQQAPSYPSPYPMAAPGYPQQAPGYPPMPPMPPAMDLSMPSLDKFIPSPENTLPVPPVSAMSPASSELPPGGKAQSGQRKKSMFPRLVGWAVALGVAYWAGRKFLGKKGDAAQDESLGNSPLMDSAKAYLSGLNKDDITEKSYKQFEEHLVKANKTLNEDEKYSDSDLKPEMTRLLQGFAEGDEEKLKDSAQALLDKKDGANASASDSKPAESKTETPNPPAIEANEDDKNNKDKKASA